MAIEKGYLFAYQKHEGPDRRVAMRPAHPHSIPSIGQAVDGGQSGMHREGKIGMLGQPWYHTGSPLSRLSWLWSADFQGELRG